MAAPVGSLVVRIGSDIRGLRLGFGKGVGIVKSFGAAASRAAKRIALISTVAVAAGVAIGVKLTRDGLKAVDAMTKLGRSLGATQAEMVALNATADLVGIAQSKMQSNILAFTKRLGEAIDGSGQAVDALEKLGLSARELAAIPLPEALALVAERTQMLGTAAERAAVESDLFSRAGIGMLTTTEDLAGAIRQATKDTQGFGVAVSQIDAAKIEAANDAMARIGLVIKGVSNQLAVKLSPLILEVADRIRGAATESRGFGDAIQTGIESSIRLMGGFIKGFREFQRQLLKIDLAAKDLRRRGLGLFVSPSELQTALRDVERAAGTLAAFQNIPPFDADAFIENVRLKSEAVTAAVKAVTSGADVGDPLGRLTGGGGEDPELEALREKSEKRLEIIRQGLLSEREAEQEAFADKLAVLEEGRQLLTIGDEEFQAQKEALEKQHQERLTGIQEQEGAARARSEAQMMANRVAAVSGFLAQMTSQLASAAEDNFKLQKALSIASAVLSGIESVIHSFNFGARIGGPILGAVFASIAAGVQFARIAQISSQQFQRGSSGAPSVATPSGGAPVPPGGGGGGGGGGAGGQSVNISLVGDRFGRTQVRDLIEEINAAVADGAKLRIV
ncbi:MAG: hypothetical protein V3S94_05200 [Gammaproteobacteria bacterium]